VWNIATLDSPKSFVEEHAASTVTISPDGELLAIASFLDKSVGVWSVTHGHRIATLNENGVRGVAFSPDGRLLATASTFNISVWDILDDYQFATFIHETDISVMAFSPNRRLLAIGAGFGNQAVKVLDVNTGLPVFSSPLEKGVTAVAFSADGRLLATSDGGEGFLDIENKAVEIWEIATGQHVTTFADESYVSAVAFSPDGRLLATGTRGADDFSLTHDLMDQITEVKVWEFASRRCVASFAHEHDITAVAFSPDGQLLATASSVTASVWEIASGRCLVDYVHEGHITAVAFSPDGSLLATSIGGGGTLDIRDKAAVIWEVASDQCLASFPHEEGVAGVAFSPDGRLLATACDDKTAGVWDISDGRRLIRLTHDDRVTSVAFSPDGRYLVTTSGDRVRFWLWQPEDLIAYIKPKLTRNLTPKEWERYIGDEPYHKTFEDLP
jgi:WD40 repeat protein